MKIQIDPVLRQNPFEFAEIFDGKVLNDEQKRDYHLRNSWPDGTKHYMHFGFYIKTNINDLARLHTIIENHLLNQVQTNNLTNSHNAAMGKSIPSLFEFTVQNFSNILHIKPNEFHEKLIKRHGY